MNKETEMEKDDSQNTKTAHNDDSSSSVEISPDELAKPLAETMPEPTGPLQTPVDDFPPDPQLQGIEQVQTGEVFRDKSGTVFDPAKHRWDDEGKKPKYNEDGLFVSTRGRKAKTKDGSTVSPASFDTVLNDEYHNAAIMYFDMSTGTLQGVISEEWAPENEIERQAMIKVIAAYLRAKRSIEVTPGQALTFACIGYAGKRLNKPKTKDKLTLWYLKVRNMFKKQET